MIKVKPNAACVLFQQQRLIGPRRKSLKVAEWQLDHPEDSIVQHKIIRLLPAQATFSCNPLAEFLHVCVFHHTDSPHANIAAGMLVGSDYQSLNERMKEYVLCRVKGNILSVNYARGTAQIYMNNLAC